MNQEKIGKYITSKRKELNLTQKEVADKIGVSDRTVSKWERGINLPDVSLYDDVCKVLDISLVELLSGEDIEEESKKEFMEKEIKKGITDNRKTKNVITILSLILICFSLFYWIIYFAMEGTFLTFEEEVITLLMVFVGLIGIISTNNRSYLRKVVSSLLCCILVYLIFNVISYCTIIFNAEKYLNDINGETWISGNIIYRKTKNESITDLENCYMNKILNNSVDSSESCFLESTDPIGYEIYITNPGLLFNSFTFIYNTDYKKVYSYFDMMGDANETNNVYKKLGYEALDKDDVTVYSLYKQVADDLIIDTVYRTDEDYYTIYKYNGKLVSLSNLNDVVYTEDATDDIDGFVKRAIANNTKYYRINEENDSMVYLSD